MAAQDVVARLQRRIMPVGGSQLGKPYGMHNLLHDCKTGMITEDVLKRVWSSLTDYIYEKLNQPQPRGVVITDFGTFSRFKTGHLLFRAAPEFKKNLSLIEPSNAPQVPSLNLPYTAVAIPAQVTQDTASIAVRRMVQELAVQARNGLTLTIPMGRLGVLWSRGRTVGFRFETKKKVRRRRRRIKTAGNQAATEIESQPVPDEPNPNPKDSVSPLGDSEITAQPVQSTEPNPTIDDTDKEDGEDGEQIDFSNMVAEMYASKPSVAAAIKAREPEERKARELPMFLRPDRFKGRQTSAALRAVALEQRYEEMAAELQDAQDRIARQEKEIELRHERAELQHRAKLEREKRRKQENLAILARLAEEKRLRDKEAAYDHRMQRDPDPANAIPQQVDPSKDAIQQVKLELRSELDKLILEKKILKRQEEKKRLAEERYFLDNLHQELVEDHQHRRKLKKETNARLREEWQRQAEMNRVAKALKEHEYM